MYKYGLTFIIYIKIDAIKSTSNKRADKFNTGRERLIRKSFVCKVFLRIKRKFKLTYALLFKFPPKLWIRN